MASSNILTVRNTKNKLVVILGNYRLDIKCNPKEINPERIAYALEGLTDKYTHSLESKQANAKWMLHLLGEIDELKQKIKGSVK